MALNVGADFKQRWISAPETIRQIFQEDLNRICHLLHPSTDLKIWLQQDHNAMQMAQVRTDKAYAQLKAQLIEQQRIRKQTALEQSLAAKRAKQAEFAAALQANEHMQFSQQTQALQKLGEDLQQELSEQMTRYGVNPAPQNLLPAEQQNLKHILQAEAESMIEQAVTVFRAKLHRLANQQIESLVDQAKSTD